MSRRRAPGGPTISLFPFLAVLLCTMGSLLVLLVLFSRSAQQSDAAAAAARAAAAAAADQQAAEDLALARDELAWRLEQLRGVRERTAAELATTRLQLAGIEDDGRAMVDEIKQLDQTAAALEEDLPSESEGEEPLADLERRLTAAREAVEDARREAADRPPAYAVVPYQGAAGTRRRPLYIECGIDGVFLQPEGIRLGPADFEGPPGPGNPLASGLRAAREHLAARAGEPVGPDTQPYPLLLVRPSGVMAYYAAREALQSWGSDFGYQFIDEDWELSFPPADPALAEVELRAVEEARRRLEWLAQVRPRERSKPAVQYRASTTRGGVVAAGGPTVLGDQSRWDWTEEQAAAAAAGRGFRADGGDSGGRGDALLGGGARAGAAGGGQWTAGNRSPAGGPGGEQFLGPSKFYGGSGQAAAGEGFSGTGTGGPAAGDAAGELADAAAARGGSRFGDAPGGGDATASGAGQGSGDGAGDQPAAGSAAGTAAGEFAAGAGAAGGGSAGQASGSAGGGGGSFGPTPPGLSGSQPQAVGASAAGDGCSGECSLAGRRGSNWASLASRDHPIPLTRPIRLECAADEFRILGSGGRVTARVPIGPRTADAVDSLVNQVHAIVGDWGMAGDRMYWKPQLVLSATPDGLGRRDDLERLLADSGLDTRRAGESDTVRSLPPVGRSRVPSRVR